MAQMPLQDPDRISLLNQIMDGRITSDSLRCEVQTFKPFLDFALRFEAGYVVRCPLSQFEGRNAAVASYLRVQPEGGQPVFLGESFYMPEMPDAMRANFVWKHLHEQAEFSGVFAAGTGEYAVELVVIDDRQRIFSKGWHVKMALTRNERKAEVAMKPDTAESAAIPPWHKEGSKSEGRQLTVFLDAAPIFPNAQRLRAWDRAFLMSSLASLLRGVNPSKVRVVAFNLDQQREIFREESFGREQFGKLGEALRRLELGSVSYKTLQASYGWADLLRGMVRQESQGTQPADAVVFLGPNLRNLNKIPKELLSCESLNSKLYYLEFFPITGAEFPDTIHQLTSTCHGSVYKMHSPADLAEAINKLQARLPAQVNVQP